MCHYPTATGVPGPGEKDQEMSFPEDIATSLGRGSTGHRNENRPRNKPTLKSAEWVGTELAWDGRFASRAGCPRGKGLIPSPKVSREFTVAASINVSLRNGHTPSRGELTSAACDTSVSYAHAQPPSRHSPCSQRTPVFPGEQMQAPDTGSHAAPCPHAHTWAQLGPKRPCRQAVERGR